MPVPFTATQIKGWLETADQPTQQQFADWVDTMFHQDQQAFDTAQDALDLVEATLPLCLGALRVEISNAYLIGSGAHTETKFREQDCTFTITHVGATQTANPASGAKAYKAVFQIDVTFGTAAANTLYTSNFALTNKTTLGCRLLVELPYLYLQPGVTNEPVWDNVTFMIWPG